MILKYIRIYCIVLGKNCVSDCIWLDINYSSLILYIVCFKEIFFSFLQTEETQGRDYSKHKISKKVNGETSKKEVLEHSIIEGEEDLEESVVTNKTEESQSTSKPEPGIGKKAVEDETKRSIKSVSKDNNFGFDSLLRNEPLDSVPDSLEVHSGNIPTDQTHSLEVHSCNIPTDQTLENNSRKKDKVIRRKERKVGSNIDIEEFSDENKLLSENIKSSAGKTEEKIKKTFCDVDRSLKELNELDTLDKTNKVDIEQPPVEQKKKSDKSSKLEKSKISGRPKQGKSKRNKSSNSSNADEAEGTTCDSDNRRHLRRRCRNYGKNENSSDTVESFSSLDNEADSVSKIISDKSEKDVNPLPLENTPENSPDKIQVNERKIKSSLKKNRKSGNSTIERNKQKSRVSFDLPYSESQEKDQEVIQNIEAPETDFQISNTGDSKVETTNSATNADPLKAKTRERTKEFSISSKEDHSGHTKKSLKDKGRAKNQVPEDDERLIKNGENKEFTESEVLTQVEVVSSPAVSTASSDSLYVESDDSYNARRYRMENKTLRNSKQRRKSSFDRIRKESPTTNKSKEDSSWKNKQEPNNIQDLSDKPQSLLKSKAIEVTEKIEKKSRKSARQSGLKSKAVRDEKAVNEVKQSQRTSEKPDSSRSLFETKQQQLVSIDKETDGLESDFTDPLPQSTESPVIDEDENEYINNEITAKKSSKADGNLTMNEEERYEQGDCSAVVPCNTSQNYMHMLDDDLQENINGKNKSSKKPKRKSLSYTVQSFEKMECDDGYCVSEHNFQRIADTKGKSTVFQMSYLKSKSKMISKNVINENKWNNGKKANTKASYDPYDFEAQCDNSSVASERVGRKDMSKELNSRQRKTNNSILQKRLCRDTSVKEERSVSSHNNLYAEEIDERKCRNSLKIGYEEIIVDEALESTQNEGKKHKKIFSRKELKNEKDINTNHEQEDGSQEHSNDVDEQDTSFQEKPKNKTLVQDKVTKRWYRTNVEENDSKEAEKNSRIQKKVKSKLCLYLQYRHGWEMK